MADSNETDTVVTYDTDATESKGSTVSDGTAGDDGTAVTDDQDGTASAEAGRATPAGAAPIGIPMPSIGGVPLPSPSIDTGAMVPHDGRIPDGEDPLRRDSRIDG